MVACGATHEITRFKRIGEISAGGFKDFIIGQSRMDIDLVEA